jgi:8-oxo-dGTP diphosphatase
MPDKIQFHMVLPFVIGIIRNNEGNILIGRHPNLQRKPYPGYWDLPGGKIESSESPEDAIKREVKEELNLDITKLRLFGVFHHSDSEILPECTSRIPGIAICYELETEGELKSTEQDDVHFARKEELIKLQTETVPWTRFFLDKLLN